MILVTIEVEDRRQFEGDAWRFRARISDGDESIRFDLRRSGDLWPTDPALIADSLRRQILIANDCPLMAQLREKCLPHRTVYFFA